METNFRGFFYSRNGVIITSILWGLGLAAMFRRVCRNRSCMVVRAPNPEWMKKQIMEKNKQCFRMMPQQSPCDDSLPEM